MSLNGYQKRRCREVASLGEPSMRLARSNASEASYQPASLQTSPNTSVPYAYGQAPACRLRAGMHVDACAQVNYAQVA